MRHNLTVFAQHGLLSCIPILRTFGINSQVDLQDVGAIKGLRHALDHYGLGQFSRLCRPFQYHFIMRLKYGVVSSSRSKLCCIYPKRLKLKQYSTVSTNCIHFDSEKRDQCPFQFQRGKQSVPTFKQ